MIYPPEPPSASQQDRPRVVILEEFALPFIAIIDKRYVKSTMYRDILEDHVDEDTLRGYIRPLPGTQPAMTQEGYYPGGGDYIKPTIARLMTRTEGMRPSITIPLTLVGPGRNNDRNAHIVLGRDFLEAEGRALQTNQSPGALEAPLLGGIDSQQPIGREIAPLSAGNSSAPGWSSTQFPQDLSGPLMGHQSSPSWMYTNVPRPSYTDTAYTDNMSFDERPGFGDMGVGFGFGAGFGSPASSSPEGQYGPYVPHTE
ncbi:hypothetical protein F5Y10DRAFT_140944 [Nemania abortiva]|nr:hypothetical protein F5Y10DRAFT_140944 [Nemania abortiva]